MKKVTRLRTEKSKKKINELETLIDHDLLMALVTAIEEMKAILADQHIMVSTIVRAISGAKEIEV